MVHLKIETIKYLSKTEHKVYGRIHVIKRVLPTIPTRRLVPTRPMSGFFSGPSTLFFGAISNRIQINQNKLQTNSIGFCFAFITSMDSSTKRNWHLIVGWNLKFFETILQNFKWKSYRFSMIIWTIALSIRKTFSLWKFYERGRNIHGQRKKCQKYDVFHVNRTGNTTFTLSRSR